MGGGAKTCGLGNTNCMVLGPPLKMMAIVAFVAGLDAIVVMFAVRPLPWAAVIPSLVPLLTTVFIVIPMLKARKS